MHPEVSGHPEGVFDDVLKIIVDLIDTCTMFGVAVDGGVDHVKHEHILVIILYVLSKSFALPPLYHPTKAAWNGKVMAEEMMKALTSLLGELRVVKMCYFMVDGSMVVPWFYGAGVHHKAMYGAGLATSLGNGEKGDAGERHCPSYQGPSTGWGDALDLRQVPFD